MSKPNRKSLFVDLFIWLIDNLITGAIIYYLVPELNEAFATRNFLLGAIVLIYG